MNSRASLIRFRRSTVLRTTTVLLLALAISPFTAPFSTWDLGMLTANAPMSAALSSDKKVKDDVTTDVVSHAFTPVLVAILLPSRYHRRPG